MLRYFAPRLPLRSVAKSLNDVRIDGGRSRVFFNEADDYKSADSVTSSQFLVTNHLPPAPEPPLDTNSPNSSLCPPFHIHLREDETFKVISGRARFLLLDRVRASKSPRNHDQDDGIIQHSIQAGERLTIPRGQIHTFRNASFEQTLILEFGFSPPGTSQSTHALNKKMKRFFLNTQLYRSDCTIQGVPRSLLQVLLFNHHADVALVPSWLLSLHRRYPSMRRFVENHFASRLGRFMNLFGGVVLGKWLFGLKSSYDEYYPSGGLDSKAGGSIQLRGSPRPGDIQRGAPGWTCQAWRDHNFDGQDESWRK